MSTGYVEKSALFCETQKALKALDMRAKQYGVDEVYNWCRFVLGAKPGSFTDGQKIAAVFFMQTVRKLLGGLADVRDIGGADPWVMPVEFKPKATYRLDEQVGWNLIQARVLVGSGVYNPLAKPEGVANERL